jgi:hypothetical protein
MAVTTITRHAKNNSSELLERQKVDTCLKLGMVCLGLQKHTDEEWDATLEDMMTPGQIRLHSTCSAFLERYWLHGRNQGSTGNIVLCSARNFGLKSPPRSSAVGVDCLRVVAVVMRGDLAVRCH